MDFFIKLKELFFKLLGFLLVALVILFLLFIAKWRNDHMNRVALVNSNVELTLREEAKILKEKFHSLTNKEEAPKEIPFIENEDELNYVTVNIPEACDLDTLGKILKDMELIKDIPTFKQMCYDMAIENKFQPGAYKMKKDLKVRDILVLLSNSTSKKYEIKVTQAMGAADVAEELLKSGVIKDKNAFLNECEKMGVLDKFKEGDFVFTSPIRVSKIIEIFTK